MRSTPFLTALTVGALLLVPADVLAQASANSGWVDNQEGCWCGYQTSVVRDYYSVGLYTSGSFTNLQLREATADALEEWNRFATLFNVVTPGSSYLATGGNGINEVSTLIKSADSTSIYGFTMATNLYGRAVMYPSANFGGFNECNAFSSSGCGAFSETDVVINFSFSSGWTPDWYDDSGSPALIQTTALHEVGHTLGFHHIHTLPAFGDSFSTMNYINDDSGRFVTRMDAKTIRAEYTSFDNTLTDMAIYPFTFGNGQYAENYAAPSTTTVTRTQGFTINNWLIQNVGSQQANTVVVTFYIWPSSAARHYPQTTDTVIGSASFGNVSADTESDMTGSPVEVPFSAADGSYWIGAIVTVGGSEDSTFVFGKPENDRFVIGGAGNRVALTVSGGPTTPVQYDSHSIDDTSGNSNGYADPGEAITMPVDLINSGGSTASSISAVLSTSTPGITITDNSATWANIAGGATGSSQSPHFAYTIGAGVACGTTIDFSIQVTSNFGTDTDTFTALVGQEVEYYVATFASNASWVASGALGTGTFERAIPEATQAQAGTDSPNDAGSMSWVTGPLAGAGVGSWDVDGGTEIVTSPTIDVSGAGSPILLYDRSYFSGANNDTYVVEISENDGGAWTQLESLANFSGSTYSDWTTMSYDLNGIGITALDQLRLRVSVTDGGQGTIAEGQIDNVRIVGYSCAVVSCTAPTFAGIVSAVDASDCDNTGVTVTWAAPTDWGDGGSGSGTRGFEIFRDSGGGPVSAGTATEGQTSFTDTNGTDGTSYTYTVEATNLDSCSSDGGATASATDNVSATPTFAGIASATDADDCLDTGVTITWAAPGDWGDNALGPGTRGFEIFRDSGGGPVSAGTATEGQTSFTDTGGVNGTSYTYTVVATNACSQTADGGASAAATDNVSTNPTFAGTPTAADADDCADTGVTVTWATPSDWGDNAVGPGTRGFEIFRDSGGGPVSAGTATEGQTSFTDTGGVNGTSYTYTVVATNGCNQTTGIGPSAAASDELSHTVDVTPGGTTSVCTGLNIVYTATPTPGAGSYTYQWYENGGLMSGETNSTLTVSKGSAQSNTYDCTVTDTGSSCAISDPTPPTGQWTACAPDIVFDSAGSWTEVCGDGDAVVEPGEEWQVTVTLRNDGILDATAVVADLEVNAGSTVSGTIFGNSGAFGAIAQAGGTGTADLSVLVDSGASCVNDITLDVTNKSSGEGTYTDELAAFTRQVGAALNESANQTAASIVGNSSSAQTDFDQLFTIPTATAATLTYTLGYVSSGGSTEVLSAADFTMAASTTDFVEWLDDGPQQEITASTATSAVVSYTATTNPNRLTAATLRHVICTVGATPRDGSDTCSTGSTEVLGIPAGGATPQTINTTVTTWFNGLTLGTGNFDTFELLLTTGSKTVALTNITFTVDGAGTGNETDNSRVRLLADGGGTYIIKDFAEAEPAQGTKDSRTLAAYNDASGGPGQWTIEVSEDAGGTATVTSTVMTVDGVECEASACTGAPPELSSASSGYPATLVRDYSVSSTTGWVLYFEDRGAGVSYNVYQGSQSDYGTWTCVGNDVTTSVGAGAWSGWRYLVDFSVDTSAARFFLVSIDNGVSEGTVGYDSGSTERPPANNDCAP